jgi:hypothetical protein
VEALILFALVLVLFQDFGLLFFFRTLVCNNGLCTSMDVEARFCNLLSKKCIAPTCLLICSGGIGLPGP